MIGIIVPLVVLGAVIVGVVTAVNRLRGRPGDSDGDRTDVIPYLLLALAVGTTVFSVAELGQAAFPGDAIVLDQRRQIATALAGLVVAAPIAVYLWIRQSRRRLSVGVRPGWTVYLSLVEATFMASLVVSVFRLLNWLIGDGDTPAWTDVIVFGAVVAFHEAACRRTPPRGDAAEVPRVIGSAIGLIALVIGVGGILIWVFDRFYATLTPTVVPDDPGRWLAAALSGAPVWWHRWLRSWPEDPGGPRKAWQVLNAVAGLAAGVVTGVIVGDRVLAFLLGSSEPAGTHFDILPATLGVGVVAVMLWAHHRTLLGYTRTDSTRAYELAMSALGLGTAIGGATGLTVLALGGPDLVGPSINEVATSVLILAAGLSTWLFFWNKSVRAPRQQEAGTWPRRAYLLVMAVITGLVAAGDLIAVLVVLFLGLLEGDLQGGDLIVPAGLFVYSGLASWHLVRTYLADRELTTSAEETTPFEVTLICSHPGMVSTLFPNEARVRVIYRADDTARVDDEMAAEIVAAVGHRSSLVWVENDGFRVAPAR